MLSERRLLLIVFLLLAAVVAAAVFAMRTSAPVQEYTSVNDLPLPTSWDGTQDLPDGCEANGGTIRYERSGECFNRPDVSDVCGFGVPCIPGDGDGYYCIDVKDPYCGCTDDAQCGDGWECDESGQRCYQAYSNNPAPYPMKPLMR